MKPILQRVSDNMKGGRLKAIPDFTADELIELIAAIEHEQWMHWSQAVAEHVTEETRTKWQRSWVDYAELTDDLKEADRVWARQVVNLLRQRNLIH